MQRTDHQSHQAARVAARGLGATLRPVAPKAPPMAVARQLDTDGIDTGRHERWYVYVVDEGVVLWHQRNGSWSRDLSGRAILNGYEAAVIATNYAGYGIPAS